MQYWSYAFVYADIRTEGFVTNRSDVSMIWTKRKNKNDTPGDHIDKLGKEGWELVSVTPVSSTRGGDSDGMTTNVLFTFKKPIE